MKKVMHYTRKRPHSRTRIRVDGYMKPGKRKAPAKK